MFKNWRKRKNEKVINYLNEQLFEKIIVKENLKSDLNDDCKTYEEIVSKLREYYDCKKYNDIKEKKKFLKSKLIALESLKLNLDNTDIIKDVSMLFTIFISFITVSLSLIKDIIKNDTNGISRIFIFIMFVFLGIIILVNIVNRVDSSIKIYNRNVSIAINIHKSVIEEKLEEIEEIEENEKQNEKSEKENHGLIKKIIYNFI